MIGVGDLKKGIAIELDGELYTILDYQHIKVGRGSAQIRLRLRNIKAGHITERTFQAGDKFPRVHLERRTVQYLYNDGDHYHFMDTETFEQTALTAEQLGDALGYIKEGTNVEVLTYNDQPIGVELPITVDLKIAETGPSFKGDTATGGTKPARLETGLVINIPLFVNNGDVIKVDTRTASYVERVSS